MLEDPFLILLTPTMFEIKGEKKKGTFLLE
jgi:hypothetical protein